MVQAIEILPPDAVYDIEFWDGKEHKTDDAGATTQGHPFVAQSHKDPEGVQYGIIARPDGDTQSLRAGDAVIKLPDGTYRSMNGDEARVRFKLASPGTSDAMHGNLLNSGGPGTSEDLHGTAPLLAADDVVTRKVETLDDDVVDGELVEDEKDSETK